MRWLALLGALGCACAWPASQTSRAVRPASGTAPAAAVEVPEVRAARPEEPPPERSPREGFAWWDRDDDGVLTEDELTSIWMAALDANGDGRIEQAEWPAG